MGVLDCDGGADSKYPTLNKETAEGHAEGQKIKDSRGANDMKLTF